MNILQAVVPSEVIDIDRLVDLLEISEIKESLNLGSVTVHKVLHPTLGMIVLIDSCSGHNGLMHLN